MGEATSSISHLASSYCIVINLSNYFGNFLVYTRGNKIRVTTVFKIQGKMVQLW